mmetsp:Transcript_1721/g.1565  ORF Transcript_1721/g.1565 Transcript_1721/m.1565 type:complete len:242 (+) Transcript_1721:77-802(+)
MKNMFIALLAISFLALAAHAGNIDSSTTCFKAAQEVADFIVNPEKVCYTLNKLAKDHEKPRDVKLGQLLTAIKEVNIEEEKQNLKQLTTREHVNTPIAAGLGQLYEECYAGVYDYDKMKEFMYKVGNLVGFTPNEENRMVKRLFESHKGQAKHQMFQLKTYLTQEIMSKPEYNYCMDRLDVDTKTKKQFENAIKMKTRMDDYEKKQEERNAEREKRKLEREARKAEREAKRKERKKGRTEL